MRVPVTVSVDTRGSLSEKETGRELKSLQWEGYNYARIDKEIKLDLCNNKPVPIEAEITLHVGGKADKTTKVASGHIDRLMKAAFGIQYLPKLKGERGYRVIDFSPYTRLARFKAMFSSYSFIDDEDPLDDLLEPR